MKLSQEEINKVHELRAIRKQNNDVGWMLSNFLNNTPCLITEKLMMQADRKNDFPKEMVYGALLSEICLYDIETNKYKKQLERDYFLETVKELKLKTYTENPYYRDIIIPERAKFGNWELKYEKFKPYEAFIYNDIILKPDFKEIQCVGFFSEEFRFPMVQENNREWMAIKPNEIETMIQPINLVKGNVVTFGLGLGYFVYMASLKEEVRSITVIENNQEVIRLFKSLILPQFQHKEKVEIIFDNAFAYGEKRMPQRIFDCAFVDLWHDISDGLNLYLKMKRMEHFNPKTKFIYWAEDTLISGFRWNMFDSIIENAQSYDDILLWLSKSFLQKLAIEVGKYH